MNRVQRPEPRRVRQCGALLSVMLLWLTACGGDDDSASDNGAVVDEQRTTTTVDPADERVPEIDSPPTSVVEPETADMPDLPDLATVGHGASLINVSTEYDQGTWSAVNLIDGRADRGWSANEPGGAFVIGLAHPTIQALGIDTRQAQEQQYPGISAVRVEIERATDLTTFPDLSWEPVGDIELEPQSIGILHTPDLFAPALRFRVTNGGDTNYVEIMEVLAWGDLTDATTTLDTIQLADVLAAESPNTTLFGEWAFAAGADDGVLACSSDGTVANLEPSDGALAGSATYADGSQVDIIFSALAATVTAIADPDGSPQVGWGVLDPAGPLSCDESFGEAAADEVIALDTSPPDEREADPPLVIAAATGDVSAVDEQLAAGADPNVARERDGWTPLLFAAQDGYTEVVDRLLEAGAAVDQGTDDNWTALMIASQNGHHDTVATLLAGGANPRVGRSTNWTALHSASLQNHPSIVSQLIAADAPLEAAEDGYTPLTIAAQQGNDAVVTLLLDAGGRAGGAPTAGPTPLYLAAQNGHASAAELLVDAGAAVDDGGTEAPPIVVAGAGSHGGVIEVLAAAGADLDRPRQSDGMTALHWAAYNDSASTAQLLLDLGANPSVTNDDGDTPLDLAEQRGADAAVTVLSRG